MRFQFVIQFLSNKKKLKGILQSIFSKVLNTPISSCWSVILLVGYLVKLISSRKLNILCIYRAIQMNKPLRNKFSIKQFSLYFLASDLTSIREPKALNSPFPLLDLVSFNLIWSRPFQSDQPNVAIEIFILLTFFRPLERRLSCVSSSIVSVSCCSGSFIFFNYRLDCGASDFAFSSYYDTSPPTSISSLPSVWN